MKDKFFWDYLSEHDEEEVIKRMKDAKNFHLIEGQVDTQEEGEYYIGYETPTGKSKLARVPKIVYDARMEVESSRLARVRRELARLIKIKT